METQADQAKINSAVKFIGFVLLFVALFLTLMRVDSYLRYQAINDCAKISTYETTDGKSKITYPIADVYNTCLEDKNLKN